MSEFSDWKRSNPKAFKRLWIGIVIAAAVLFGSGVFWGNKLAHAQDLTVVTVDCGAGLTPVWDATAKKVTCIKTGTTPPPVVTPPVPVPSDPFAGCPANALKIDGQWGNTAIETRNFGGGFGQQIMSVRVAVPASWATTSTRTSSWAEFIDGPTTRYAVFSTAPCDFSTLNALKDSRNMPAVAQDAIGFAFKYRVGSAGLGTVKVEPGKVYFINVRNINCGDGRTCNMRGGLPQ